LLEPSQAQPCPERKEKLLEKRANGFTVSVKSTSRQYDVSQASYLIQVSYPGAVLLASKDKMPEFLNSGSDSDFMQFGGAGGDKVCFFGF
jgi:hypothetical protein